MTIPKITFNYKTIKPIEMKEATLVTYDTSTRVSLHMNCGMFRKVFNGVFEAVSYCIDNEINLKHHVNNQPAPKQ